MDYSYLKGQLGDKAIVLSEFSCAHFESTICSISFCSFVQHCVLSRDKMKPIVSSRDVELRNMSDLGWVHSHDPNPFKLESFDRVRVFNSPDEVS
jgi:Zn-finger protein